MTTDDNLIHMFYEIDVDKSGVIDCDELRKYLREKNFGEFFITVIECFIPRMILLFNLYSFDHLKRFLKAFDSDRDGKITFEEFRRGLHKVPHQQKTYSQWHQILHRVDRDKNGYITLDEIQQMIIEGGSSDQINPKDLQAFIREYDQDGDGKLNYHEFLDYLLDQPNQSSSKST